MPGQEGGILRGGVLKGTTTQLLLALTVLTAAKGVNTFMDHEERWYNLDMSRVVQTAKKNGIPGSYSVRPDGVKTYNGFVICAGAPERYGEIIDTSLGKGLIIDTGEFVEEDPTMIDIATNW